MSAIRFLAADELARWLARIADTRQVLAPRKEGKSVVFRPLIAGETPSLARATVSPKAAVLPPCETLIRFRGTKDLEDPGKVSINLETNIDAVPTVVFGGRSCDARGFLVLDQAFLKGRFQDPYYKTRRDNLLIVTQTCTAPCSTCFCHWTGGGPTDTTGSDVVFTPVQDGFVLEAVSERGESFLAEFDLLDGADKIDAANTVKEQSKAMLAPAPDISSAPQRLEARFTDMNFWTAQTAKCLSCGACTYMCPTCQCFSITDEGNQMDGRRLRSWDNCMSPLFTREASGHNPRVDKAMRMRNRVSHKYWYAPGYANGQIACTGCGRCIRQCPVSLDIREIVLHALTPDTEAK